jgi:5-methylcytosine-specific restriction endonuclease McrA
MNNDAFQELTQQLFKTTKQTDLLLAKLKQKANEIEAKYDPRTEFNRWRSSTEGQLWKQQKYQFQNGCCAICRKQIELIGAHIDHIKPIATHPHLALETPNLQIACLTCNASKGDRTN